MAAAIVQAGLGFLTAGFVGFAMSFFVGVIVADLAAIGCLGGGCGAFAHSVAAVGGSLAAAGGALAGFRNGARQPDLSA